MAIDINKETLMTLAQASRMLPLVRSKKVHTSTLWRWCRKGRHGITLEYLRMGAKIITTQEAMQRFFAALAEQDSKPMCHRSPSDEECVHVQVMNVSAKLRPRMRR